MKDNQRTPLSLTLYGNLKYFLHVTYWLGIIYTIGIYIPYLTGSVLNIDKNILWYIYSIFLVFYVGLFFIVAIALQNKSTFFSGKNLSFNFFKIFIALVIAVLLLGSEHFTSIVKMISIYNGVQIGIVVVVVSLIVFLFEKYFYTKLATSFFTNARKLESIPEFPLDIESKQQEILVFLQGQVKEKYRPFIRPTDIKTRFKTGLATTTVQFAYKTKIFGFEVFNELFKLIILEELDKE